MDNIDSVPGCNRGTLRICSVDELKHDMWRNNYKTLNEISIEEEHQPLVKSMSIIQLNEEKNRACGIHIEINWERFDSPGIPTYRLFEPTSIVVSRTV
jgi:hypothetical protein